MTDNRVVVALAQLRDAVAILADGLGPHRIVGGQKAWEGLAEALESATAEITELVEETDD